MGKIPLTTLPRREFSIWKSTAHSLDCPLRPLALRILAHPIFEYCLHQAMNGKRLCIGITAQQGELAQFFDSSIQCKRIGSNSLKNWAELGRTIGDKLLCDSIRV